MDTALIAAAEAFAVLQSELGPTELMTLKAQHTLLSWFSGNWNLLTELAGLKKASC